MTVLDDVYAAVSGNISAISNDLLYTGRRRDPETGLQLNRNRFYASHLGRWVNRDPIGYDGGTNNLYEYVDSMPAVSNDPEGKFKVHSSCRVREGNCIHRVLSDLKSILQRRKDCFGNTTNNKRLDCPDCRSQLTECMLKTIESKITIRCVNPEGRYRNWNGSTLGPCVNSKDPTKGGQFEDRSCNACSDDKLDKSIINLVRGNVGFPRECTSLNMRKANGLYRTLVHELAHNCGADLENGSDTFDRPGAKRVENDWVKNCSNEVK